MIFKLEIVSPASKVFEGEVKSVSIPGTLGNFQVLKNHAPMISTFTVGKIKIENHTGTLEFSTGGGVFEVKNNNAIVLAESIESKEEINLERAKRSKIRAEELLKSSDLSSQEKEDAKFALQRAINRLKFIEKN